VSVKAQIVAYAIGILSNFIKFHLYIRNSTTLYLTLVLLFVLRYKVMLYNLIIHINKPPTCPLRPVNLNNTCSFRITAAAGTKFAGASSANTVNFVFTDSALQIVSYSSDHTRNIAGSSFRSLSNIPHCCLP